MKSGILTFTETPDGTVNVHVDFGPGDLDAESPAHYLLLVAVTAANSAHLTADGEDDDD